MSHASAGRDLDEPYTGVEYSEATPWVAWVLFAAVILALVGALEAVMGLVALLDPGFVPARQSLPIPVGRTALGWLHIALGVLAIVTSVGLLRGRLWARLVGIILAVTGVVVNLTLVAAFPVWGVLAIVFDVLTMYALAAHGGEVAAAQGRPSEPATPS